MTTEENIKVRDKYLFAGGGTGGHLYPGIAIAEKILTLKPEADIIFVGTRKGLECRVIPQLGYALHLIAVRGFARSRFFVNVTVPFRLVWSLVQSAVLIHKIKPNAVIGTGGYVSGPVLYMASLLKYPSLIQEQNSYPGVTTRLLAKHVDRVHISFAETKKYLKDTSNIFLTGNPVRKLDKISRENARKAFELTPQKPTLLVFGGSQGALILNIAVLAIVDDLMSGTDIQIIWGVGRWDLQAALAAAAKYPGRIRAMAYIDEMAQAYSAADLVVCRAGALTLAEITQCGLPSILIPFARAAGSHQEANAKSLQKLGAAEVILEGDLQPEILSQKIVRLLDNPSDRRAMAEAASKAAYRNAAEEIVRSILSLERVN